MVEHVIPWSLWPLQEAPIPQEKNKNEVQCGDIGTILTFLAKCFQTLKETCSLAYVQHKVLNKFLLCFINILVWVYWPKKRSDCKTNRPNLFLPMLLSMICFKKFYHLPSLNTKFLLASKWRWTLSTCVFIGVMPLIFPYLMRPFLITKLNGFKCYEKLAEISRWCTSTFEDSTYQQASCHL